VTRWPPCVGVYRAFFEPGVFGWPEHACRGCSFAADHAPPVAHLNARDTTLVFVTPSPQADIERVKARMGWKMPWYTMTDGFDVDFGVDQWHGTNAFIHDGGQVYRTYFVNNRGDSSLGTTWSYLDITALGRQEDWEDSPHGYRCQGPRSQVSQTYPTLVAVPVVSWAVTVAAQRPGACHCRSASSR
jgi:predicted dithiol-disulfide oxidoreductase (DUF899 family)